MTKYRVRAITSYYEDNCKIEEWGASVGLIAEHGSHWELDIKGRGSQFNIVVGEYKSGWFLCVPNLDVGTGIAHPADVFYTIEKLSKALDNEVDAHTIARGVQEYFR